VGLTVKESYREKFWEILSDLFVGAKTEGKSGYVNLLRVKNKYFKDYLKPEIKRLINEELSKFPTFEEELYTKLYSFFHRYFSESGSIYFSYTPLYYKIYEKVYESGEEKLKEVITYSTDYEQILSDKEDVSLFWKTHMLYYIKTDRIIRSMKIEMEDEGFSFFFNVSDVELKKGNEKRQLIYELEKIEKDGTIILKVLYSERGRKTKVEELLKQIRKRHKTIKEETIKRAIRVFEKQSTVDYFINKDAEKFLKEQFDLWMYQYLFSQETSFTRERFEELFSLKRVAYRVIELIARFEDELKKIWEKPRFVFNSNYVITLDRIAKKEGGLKIIKEFLKAFGMEKQIEEWKELGIVDEDFKKEDILTKTLQGERLNEKYQFLPIDTKHFKELKWKILKAFDNLDDELDGWLIKSENWQALNTVMPKFREKVQTIYIDPPYNSKSTEISYENGYRDSTWITLMENRLKLAKQLLSRSGSITVAIDDYEFHNLKYILDIAFGKENHVSNICVIHNPGGRSDDKFFATAHEYAIVYAKNIESLRIKGLLKEGKKGKTQKIQFRRTGSNSTPDKRPNLYYPIYFNPATKEISLEKRENFVEILPIDSQGNKRVWRWGKERFLSNIDKILVEENNGKYNIFVLEEEKEFVKPKTFWNKPSYASSNGTKSLKDLFADRYYFDFPKSVSLVKDFIFIQSDRESIILDFFAGSGTTAHAVMKLNKEDNGKRRFILIEMADYFYTVIIPRIKKLAFSLNWKSGKPKDNDGIGIFVKYYELEQYEDILKTVEYGDSDIKEYAEGLKKVLKDDFTYSKVDPFIFDKKLSKAVRIDEKTGKAFLDFSQIYPDREIDIAETLSNLKGLKIKKLTREFVEFENGDKVYFKNLQAKDFKELLLW